MLKYIKYYFKPAFDFKKFIICKVIKNKKDKIKVKVEPIGIRFELDNPKNGLKAIKMRVLELNLCAAARNMWEMQNYNHERWTRGAYRI